MSWGSRVLLILGFVFMDDLLIYTKETGAIMPRAPKHSIKKHRHPVSQPPSTIKIKQGSTGPSHGVSGYAVLGEPGGFNIQLNSAGISTGNAMAAGSAYSIQASGSPMMIIEGNDYDQWKTPSVPTAGIIDYGQYTSEPSLRQAFSGAPGTVRGSLVEAQSSMPSSGSSVISNLETNMIGRAAPEPTQGSNRQMNGSTINPHPGIHISIRPDVNPRQDNQNSGTVNYEASVQAVRPQGQGGLTTILDSTTPGFSHAGYSGTGTHPAHGPTPSSHYDGSWTLDVNPQQQPVGLSDLPPAADVPVQTYTGLGPQNASSYFMRFGGGVNALPSMQRVAVFT